MVRVQAWVLRWSKLVVVVLQKGTRLEWALAMTALHDWTLGRKPLEWVEAERQC
jgi:hypothetical protein